MEILTLLITALLGTIQYTKAQGINVCSNFPQRHQPTVEIYIDDAKGDGSLRLCHCQVYASNYKAYVATAIAIKTGAKGVTLRTLTVGTKNSTIHMNEGFTYTSTEVLSMGITYLKNSRSAATFTLSMLPLTPMTDLVVQCASRREGFLPDGVDVLNENGKTKIIRDPGSETATGGNSGTDSTVIALSVLIIVLVAIIASLIYYYLKIRNRYSMIKQEIKYNENGDGSYISKKSQNNQGYEDSTESSYEPIPAADHPNQIHKFKMENRDSRSPSVEIESKPLPPVAVKRSLADSSIPREIPSAPPPRPNKRSLITPVQESYVSIDPKHVSMNNDMYTSLEPPSDT